MLKDLAEILCCICCLLRCRSVILPLWYFTHSFRSCSVRCFSKVQLISMLFYYHICCFFCFDFGSIARSLFLFIHSLSCFMMVFIHVFCLIFHCNYLLLFRFSAYRNAHTHSYARCMPAASSCINVLWFYLIKTFQVFFRIFLIFLYVHSYLYKHKGYLSFSWD